MTGGTQRPAGKHQRTNSAIRITIGSGTPSSNTGSDTDGDL